jgi:predicted nucleic acid-binding protein
VSWLLDPDKLTGKIVRSLDLELHTPYMAVSELWKHRDDWSRRKPSIDLQQFTSAIGYYVNVVQPDQYAQEMSEAKAVMGRIDPDDSEFVALALKLGAPVGPTTSTSNSRAGSAWSRAVTSWLLRLDCRPCGRLSRTSGQKRKK